MSNIRYSIIIPHYNTPDLLLRCLESIPEQDDIQVIVVDDNSSYADKYKLQYPRLYRKNVQICLTKQGRGAGYARNIGLQYAIGKWVLFADADDFYVKDFIKLLDENYDCDADIVYFNVKSVMSDDVNKLASRNNAKDKLFEDYTKTRDSSLFRCLYCEPWGKMVKYELIKNNHIKFDETRVDNDHYFSVVSGCLANDIKVVNKPLYVVTLRTGSLSFDFANDIDKLLTRLYVETRVQLFERKHGYNIKPMPIRGLMVLLLKKDPKIFIRYLLKIKREGISVIELLIQMFNPKYMK